MTKDELWQIEERADRATKGPHAIENDDEKLKDRYRIIPFVNIEKRCAQRCSARPDYTATVYSRGDALFFAHAREDIPALIARVRELEAQVEKYKRLEEAAKVVSETAYDDILGDGLLDALDTLDEALTALEKKS